LAKSIAAASGMDLSHVQGSGPNGRIIKRDLENVGSTVRVDRVDPDSTGPASTADAIRPNNDIRISQMRKTIAKRLAESMFTNPHFYETIDIDMKNAVATRDALNASGDVKISFNDLVVKASAMALKKHPAVNSSWLGDVIREYGSVHVAVAVAIEDGLVTPVIRHTDLKGLAAISAETKDLAKRARDRKLEPKDWEGSTFTISNLGMFGIEEFTAIINPPNACILAVGAIRDVPVVENGAVVPGKRMKVTLSSDHRVVDGAVAAQFLNTLRGYLEQPATMLL
jgi:pyruvate dehydrogenase E2 component (dihydrolipoamide acetyltransferase)